MWTLYWPDRDERWHLFDDAPPAAAIGDLLQVLFETIISQRRTVLDPEKTSLSFPVKLLVGTVRNPAAVRGRRKLS